MLKEIHRDWRRSYQNLLRGAKQKLGPFEVMTFLPVKVLLAFFYKK